MARKRFVPITCWHTVLDEYFWFFSFFFCVITFYCFCIIYFFVVVCKVVRIHVKKSLMRKISLHLTFYSLHSNSYLLQCAADYSVNPIQTKADRFITIPDNLLIDIFQHFSSWVIIYYPYVGIKLARVGVSGCRPERRLRVKTHSNYTR